MRATSPEPIDCAPAAVAAAAAHAHAHSRAHAHAQPATGRARRTMGSSYPAPSPAVLIAQDQPAFAEADSGAVPAVPMTSPNARPSPEKSFRTFNRQTYRSQKITATSPWLVPGSLSSISSAPQDRKGIEGFEGHCNEDMQDSLLGLPSISRDKNDNTVVLNVYDLNPSDAKKKVITNANDWSLLVGIGAFHSGVQVYGVEWAFGSSQEGYEAIQPCVPRRCCPNQYTYRTSIEIGRTSLSMEEVEVLIQDMADSDRYQGYNYNILKNNCNDFTDDLCKRLTGQRIPKWVNRGARALDGMITGARKVATHPITKSFMSAIRCAKKGVEDGVTVGYSAVCKTVEVSQTGLRTMYTRMEGLDCLGGGRLLRTCYGNDAKEEEHLIPLKTRVDTSCQNEGAMLQDSFLGISSEEEVVTTEKIGREETVEDDAEKVEKNREEIDNSKLVDL